MAQDVHSWSQPINLAYLIGRKRIDWSVFESGSHIPEEFHGAFAAANHGELVAPGERREVTLDVEGVPYKAWMIHSPRPDTGGSRIQLRYDSNSDLKNLIRAKFNYSHHLIGSERAVRLTRDQKRPQVRIPAEQAEYMDFYSTDRPYHYRVEFVTKGGLPVDLNNIPFDQVWRDLQAIINGKRTVLTLGQQAPNTLRWLGDAGIEVTTEKGTEVLSPDIFEKAWLALASAKILTSDSLPDAARYRSSVITSTLCLLPYVDHTTFPKTTLFLKQHVFSHSELFTTFGVGSQGGIRYSGTPDSPRLVVFVTRATKDAQDHPYHDRWEGEVLHYTGEGLKGDQTLTKGNLALNHNLEHDYPLFGFSNLAPNKYQYLGRFKVESVSHEQQVDMQGFPRQVYIFHMKCLNPKADYDEAMENGHSIAAEPILDLAQVVGEFASALRTSNISFGTRHEEVTRTFIASLTTKPFVILTGLSGSGKTQIAIRFGEWLGGRSRVIPVRPDWTGPEALLGYPDALREAKDGRSAWHVPDALSFMLEAARNPMHPYLLILDEMNLAHVERYFADVLSGMESEYACLPNLRLERDGTWRSQLGGPERIPIPKNLFIIGTVNVDETTYMFSPKVLDRANTIEFRVDTSELDPSVRKPTKCTAGDPRLVQGFLEIAVQDDWPLIHLAARHTEFVEGLRTIHAILQDHGFEFGHRVFYEAIRFAALLTAAGEPTLTASLDHQVMQKILPRLHGNRRVLEPMLCALGQFCFDLSTMSNDADKPGNGFDPLKVDPTLARLPQAFQKIRRMTRAVRANQFASFTE